MNNYGQWWDDVVTLFNKFVDKDTGQVFWYSTVLDDCFYDHQIDRMTIGNTVIESNVSICRIRVDDDFVNKRVWEAFSDDNRRDHFTLGVGDIIVAGEVDFDIDEYTKGKRSSDLIAEYKDYPGCFTIQTVSINVGGGRGNEHYLARGV